MALNVDLDSRLSQAFSNVLAYLRKRTRLRVGRVVASGGGYF